MRELTSALRKQSQRLHLQMLINECLRLRLFVQGLFRGQPCVRGMLLLSGLHKSNPFTPFNFPAIVSRKLTPPPIVTKRGIIEQSLSSVLQSPAYLKVRLAAFNISPVIIKFLTFTKS